MNFLPQVYNMAMDIVSKLCLIFMFALTDCKKGFCNPVDIFMCAVVNVNVVHFFSLLVSDTD